MAVSYNGLWKLLIDKNMKKVDMMNQVGISKMCIRDRYGPAVSADWRKLC